MLRTVCPLAAAALAAWCAAALPSSSGEAPRETVVTPKTHGRHLRNPGMGLVFYGTADPLPEEADVLFATAVWHDVEKAPGEYDWRAAKGLAAVLAAAEKHDRRVAIRLVTSWQNYPSPIPEHLVKKGVKLFPHKETERWGFKCFLEPEWWNPDYVKAYAELVKAYGREFDGRARLEWIDMRYYGFWGEGHRFAASQPWPASTDKREYCRRWIDAHLEAFRKTPLAVQTASDEKTPYPKGTAIDYALEKGAWMRRDGFGCFLNAGESRLLKDNWKRSVVIAENGRSLRDHLDGKVRKDWIKGSPAIPVEALFEEMLDHHVNYLPLGWGLADFKALKEKRPELLEKASLRTGYRLVVREARWPARLAPGAAATVRTVWRNTAVGRLPFRHTPALYLLDAKGQVKAETGAGAAADPTAWFEGADHDVAFDLRLPAGLAPGDYTVAVALVDERKRPAIALGIEGDDGQRRYALGTIRVAGD